MTAADILADLRAKLETTTPGPWRLGLTGPDGEYAHVLRVDGIPNGIDVLEALDEDAEAIVALRNAAPGLLKALEDVLALTCASDDGSEYSHHGHSPILGEPECPACWADSIRTAIEAALAEVDHG